LPAPSIDLPLTAYIPEEYVSDLDTRLNLYQRLVKLDTVEQIAALSHEFNDRFGALPPVVNNLIYMVQIKALAAKASIESITTEDGLIILRRFQGMQFDRQPLEPIIRDGIKVGISQLRLNPRRLGAEWQKVLEEVIRGLG
jgi:transcription-repair coupling factor (superfamily II helicase)